MSAYMITRRQAVLGTGALLGLSALGLSAQQASAGSGAVVEFDIAARGQKVGTHTMQFKRMRPV